MYQLQDNRRVNMLFGCHRQKAYHQRLGGRLKDTQNTDQEKGYLRGQNMDQGDNAPSNMTLEEVTDGRPTKAGPKVDAYH